jgi:hypothetical protein
MADWSGAPLRRKLVGAPGRLRRVLTVVGVVLALYSLLGVGPARAFVPLAGTAGTSTTTPQPTGLETATTALIKPAPAGFKEQLANYVSQLQQVDQQYPVLVQTTNLQKAALTAQRLVAAANAKDLAALYYLWSRGPSMSTVIKYLRLAGKAYTEAMNWESRSSLRTLNYDDSCPAPGATVTLITVLDSIYKFFSTLYEIFPASFTIEVFGAALTIPISPIRDAFYWIAVVAPWAADFGVNEAYKIRIDCTYGKHYDEHDTMATYIQDHVANEQVNLAVTPIDAYHFLIAAHENGQPLNVTTNGVQLETFQGPASSTGQSSKMLISNGTPLLSNGTPTAGPSAATAAPQCGAPTSSTITQVALCQVQNTDAGLYELFIPTTLVGTSYRLIVDDGAQCPNDPQPAWPAISNCDHYGVAVFTKTTNS